MSVSSDRSQEEQVELANPLILEELLATRSMPPPRRPRAGKPPTSAAAGSPLKAKRCGCGDCPRCLESARWERIFNKKFADPNYYKHRPARIGSSMGWTA
jgi:hypothetical protein